MLGAWMILTHQQRNANMSHININTLILTLENWTSTLIFFCCCLVPYYVFLNIVPCCVLQFLSPLPHPSGCPQKRTHLLSIGALQYLYTVHFCCGCWCGFLMHNCHFNYSYDKGACSVGAWTSLHRKLYFMFTLSIFTLHTFTLIFTYCHGYSFYV